MAEDRIDSIIDRPAVQAEIDATKKEVADLVALIKSVKGTAVGISGAKSASEYAALRRELELQIKATNAAAKAAINEAKTREANAKAARQEAVASRESTKAKNEEEKATQQTAKAKKLEENYTRQLIKAKEALNKEAVKEADKIAKLNSAYEQLKHREQLAANAVKDLAAAKGLDNAETQEALAVQQRYYQQLLRIEQAVGQSQRNVGNYTQATFALTQVLREAPAFANSFAIGISALSNNIPILVSEIQKLTAANNALRLQGLKTIPVFTILAKSIFSLSGLLPIAFLALQLFAGGMFGAGKATKQFSADLNDLEQDAERVKDSIEAVNKQLDFLQKIGEITVDINFGDDFERSSLKAQSASIRLDQEIFKLQEGLVELQGVAQQTWERFSQGASRSTQDMLRAFAPGSFPDDLIADVKKGDQKLVKLLNDQFKNVRDTETKIAEKEKERIIARANIRLNIANEARRKEEEAAKEAQRRAEEAERKRLELLERNRKAEFDLQRQPLEFNIEKNKRIAEDEERALVDRLYAARRFFEDSGELIILQRDFELNTAGKTAKEKLAIEQQAGYDLARLTNTFNAMRLKAQKDFNDAFHANEEQLAKDLQNSIQETFDAWQKRNADRIKLQAETAEKLIESEKQIAKESRAIHAELYKELAKTVSEFFEAGIDRRIHALQAEADQLELQKQRDIDIVNQTVTNRQQAAAEITIIEARAAAARETLAIKQREEEKKKANIEKLGQIATIIGTTAKGIVDLTIKAAEARAQAAVLLSNPFTAPFAPIALAQAASIAGQIPFIIGIGAAQIARLALPRYKEGTKNKDGHPGGLAIVGDGGKSEGIRFPDGTIARTPSTSTVVDLPEGTQVYPDFNKMMLNATMTKAPVFVQQVKQADGSGKVVKELKEVKKAIKKIPQTSVQVQNLLRQRIRYGTSINDHITRNIGNNK